MGFLSGLFGSGGNETSSNTTSSYSSADTTTSTDSHNVAVNTSSNYSSNATSTLTQDRRLVTDGGATGVTADNSTVTTTMANSNNSYSNDSGHNTTVTDFGSVAGGLQLGATAIAANQALALQTIDASKYMTNSGFDMLKLNMDFAQHVSDSATAEARNAIREVSAASNNALNQVVGIASKPLNAQDPQHVLVIVGMCVIGAVLFSKI